MQKKLILSSILLYFVFINSINSSLLDQANSLYNEGKLIEAVSIYKKAASEGENLALCFFNCANAYFQIDSIPQSIVYYKASISYAPDFFRAHLNLAIAYYSLDEIGECIGSIFRALQIEPDDEKALTILAASYKKVGAIPEAITTFEQIAIKYQDKGDSYIALAEMYRDLSDDEQAIKWLLKYPESGQNEAYVYQMLSEIYEVDNNIEKALYYSREVFQKEPANKWILYRICTLTEQMGNDLVALEEAKRGLEQFPDFSDLAVFAGNIAMKYEHLDDAKRLYTIGEKYGHPNAVVGLDNIRKIILSKTQQGEH